MSTSIENLRRIAGIDIDTHTEIFDAYVCSGKDIDELAAGFGYDVKDITAILEG